MLASLPMYDLPEVRSATDAWWKGLASAFSHAGVEGVPDRLTHSDDLEALWRNPHLLLSQTCGYPLMHGLSEWLQPVATPVYDAPGCVGPRYASAIVVGADNLAVRLEELRGAVCAINSRRSQSGYNCLRAMVASLVNGECFFSGVIESGAHANSLALVAGGDAGVCAIDCVTHALIARHRPAALAGTRVLVYTEAAPGLPYVTRANTDPDLVRRLREGLWATLVDPGLASAREALLLVGAESLALEDYDVILAMEERACAQGYPELR